MQDIEAEQGLIGAVLINNALFAPLSERVSGTDFSEQIHGSIWDICQTLITAGKMASPITVRQFIPKDMIVSGEVSIKVYLARLAASSCTLSEAPHLASLVRDLADRRTISAIGRELSDVKAEPTELAVYGVEVLDAIVARRSITGTPAVTMAASAARAVDDIARAYQCDGALQGMSYGLGDLDRKTGGLQRGELTVLAGRPGMMKTGLALSFTRAFCEAGLRGVFFSLEMGDRSLSRRIFSDLLFERKEIPYLRMRLGKVSEPEFTMIRDAALQIKDWPLRIEQESGLSISQMSARARQMKRGAGLDFLVVDHIGHIAVSDRYRGNRTNEIGEITGGLLKLARELDIGLIALHQLSRGVESRENKRPVLSDLRDSGAVEQDAATVLMVYREAYYLANTEPRPGTPEYEIWTEKMLQCLHHLDIVIAKQRDGATGSVQSYVDIACNAVRPEGWSREVFVPELAF